MVGCTRNDYDYYDCAEYDYYDDCAAHDYDDCATYDYDKFDCADHYDYDHDKFDCADYYYICCGPWVGWVCWLFGRQVLGWF